jgi:hypothetical protein
MTSEDAVYVGRFNMNWVKSHEVLGKRVNGTEVKGGLEDKARAEVYKMIKSTRTTMPCWPDVALA